MNKVFLMGNIGKDPDIRYSNDKAVARFSLAVRRRFTREGDQDTDWLNVVAFSKLAEFCEKYLRKGSKIIVEGRINTGSYTNKEGQKVYTTDIIAEQIEFAESKKDSENNAPVSNPANTSSVPADDGFDNSDDGFMTVEEEMDSSLPFN